MWSAQIAPIGRRGGSPVEGRLAVPNERLFARSGRAAPVTECDSKSRWTSRPADSARVMVAPFGEADSRVRAGRPAGLVLPPDRKGHRRGADHEHRDQRGDDGGLGAVTAVAQRIAVGLPSAPPARPPPVHCVPGHCWRPFHHRHPVPQPTRPGAAMSGRNPTVQPSQLTSRPCPLVVPGLACRWRRCVSTGPGGHGRRLWSASRWCRSRVGHRVRVRRGPGK
jgi:hypothetical protein